MITILAWAGPQHPLYREWRYSRLSLAELQRERAGRLDDPRLLYYVGRRLNEQERFAEADPFLRYAVGLDPDTPRLREEWTRALLGSGLTKAAFGNLREFSGTHPGSAMGHILLGKFYFTERSMKRAAEEMEAAIAIEPENGTAWSYLAGARDALGETQSALEAAKKTVALKPDSAADHLTLAGLFAKTDRRVDARREFERAIQCAPLWSTANREYARWLLTAGIGDDDMRTAEKAAAQAVARDPSDASAQLALGRAALRLNRPDAALPPLTRAATLAPDDPAAPLSLSQAYARLGNRASALEWQRSAASRERASREQKMLGEALRAHPEDPQIHRRLARLLGQRGDVDGCVHRHASALHAALDSPPVLIAAANDLTDGGHADKALPLARRAADVGAANPAAHEAFGNALLGVGQAREAAVAYHKAAGWWPEKMASYRQKLAAFYSRQESVSSPAESAYRTARRLESQQFGPKRITPQVEDSAQKAVALEPNNPRYLAFLLQIQMMRQHNTEAEATARRLLTIAPDDTRTHALLAMLLVDKAKSDADYAIVESHLKTAEYDATTAPTRAYVRGEMALRRGDGAGAVKSLREAAELDPNADIVRYKLMLAETMAGNKEEAARSLADFQRRRKDKTDEARILGDIAQKPDQQALYERAIRFYADRGQPEQAGAIHAEAERRFGQKIVAAPAAGHGSL